MVKMQSIQLSDVSTMPMIGFGTWQLFGSEGRDAIQTALQAGYRLIDTAEMYGNEHQVGEAVKESGIIRPNIFITTKIKPTEPGKVTSHILERLNLLQVDYIDLVLIHWPASTSTDNIKIWNEFIKAKDNQLVKHIGVSNFNESLLTEITSHTAEIPAVNQIEVNPLVYPKELIAFCHEKGIVVQAYSPFGKGRLLKNRKLSAVAHKYGVTSTRLLIRWSIQHQLVPLPRSSNPEHIVSNLDVYDFAIADTDMERLDTLAG